MAAKLPAQVQKTAGIPNGMRTATVTAVAGSKVTINVSGGTFQAGVGVLTSYAPRVGDVVAVFRQDSSWLILGPTSGANPWVSFSSLGYQNGWSDRQPGTFPIGQYRIASDEVKMVGEITNASVPSGIIVSGLPPVPGEVVLLGSMGAVRVRLTVDSVGALKIFDATAAGTLQFCCAYPLDARLS